MTAAIVFDQIGIIGLGLVGSSIARAVRKHHLSEFIVGCDNNDTTLAYARSHNFIDTGVRDPALAANGSQLVIIATPPSSLGRIAKEIAPNLQPGTIVMDTASVKHAVMEMMGAHLPVHTNFVPSHPVAGSELSGISYGSDTLFQRRRIIVTPNEALPREVLQAVTSFWVGMGARIEAMPAAMHDRIYAYISHLPHLLAYAARDAIGSETIDPEDVALQKFLRLSASRVTLWSEIFSLNKDNLLMALEHYLSALQQIEEELSSAPENAGETPVDDALVRTVLFPRIAASCLITAVIDAEKQTGLSFARYAGRGFADFTFAASSPPEEDIETISNHHRAVCRVVGEYAARLRSWKQLLSDGQFIKLQQEIASAGHNG